MATDWFRQETWDEKIEQDFLARLSRSPSQRDQYLVIQVLTIAKTFPAVALRLADIYFETKKDNFDDVRAFAIRCNKGPGSKIFQSLALHQPTKKSCTQIFCDRTLAGSTTASQA